MPGHSATDGTDARRGGEREPQNPEEARRAIRATRGRISETLDDIEDLLVEKKERLKERANVLRPVQERVRAAPWPAVGIAFGLGIVLSRLRRGGGDEVPRIDAAEAEHRREATRRWRQARRERLDQILARREHAAHDDSNGAGLRGAVVGALASAINDGFRRIG